MVTMTDHFSLNRMTFPAIVLFALAGTSCGQQPTGQQPARQPNSAPVSTPLATATIDAGVPVDAAPAPPPEKKLVLTKARFADLKGWTSDRHGEALAAFNRSCVKLLKKKSATVLGLNPIAGTAGDWHRPCRKAAVISAPRKNDAKARAFFEEHFTPYAAANHDDRQGRFTGYYNARIRASKKKTSTYKVPVYGRPKDLVTIDLGAFFEKYKGERLWGKMSGTKMVPFDTRAQIYGGSLAGRAKVLMWASSMIDVFFAQVQGSATVEFGKGKRSRIGVGGKNGHIYTAIGRVLIADGELTRQEVSMQSIRQWMLEHPSKAQDLLEKNKAYIFFTEYTGPGPYGSQGVVVTPGRTLAVDLRMIPHSVPIWLETEVPPAKGEQPVPWQRLMIAQDTGGAIRGPVRGDIYFGDDDAAFAQAGRMKGMGQYYLLLPNTVSEPTR